MTLELFTPLYMSLEQIALLPMSLSIYLPLYLFALIWLQLYDVQRKEEGGGGGGGGGDDCREMVGRPSEAKRDREEEEEASERRGGKVTGASQGDAAVNNNISESQYRVCGGS